MERKELLKTSKSNTAARADRDEREAPMGHGPAAPE